MKCEACDKENIDGARFCASCGALLPADKSADDPLIGQLVGSRYRVTRVLGEGGMGVVYVGEQQMGSTVRKVAIKTLHQHLSKDPSVLARFHRECGTVAQLEHPNTIKFYDFGATSDGTLYIAMEFVAGKPLSQVIEAAGSLSPARVVKIMRQICGALDEAHKQGIVHRDLKPENIILSERAGETDFVKVLDFGIAARTESADAQKEQKLTQQGMVLGTPPYMSPEQFTGKALDLRSDIYSLGIMAYEMLTGRLPFDADTPWQWATQHMTAQPVAFEVSAPGKDIPESMRTAILRALSKERGARQESAHQFFDELSEGARITVERAAVSSGGTGSTGTAAMAAAPSFAAEATAHTAAMPQTSHVAPAPAAPQLTPGAMVAAASPMIAPRAQRGNKGLIVGLSVVGGALLVTMAVIGARQLGNKDDTTPPLFPTSDAATPATNVTPTTTVDPVVDVEPPATDTGTPTPTRPTTPRTGTGTGTSKPDAGPPKPDAGTTTPPTTPPTTTPPTTPPDKDPGGKDPKPDTCAACLAAANSGNFPAAAAKFRTCTDASLKSECASKVKTGAGQAVKSAALNGDCGKAKAIAAAANSMGAGSAALAASLKKGGCT